MRVKEEIQHLMDVVDSVSAGDVVAAQAPEGIGSRTILDDGQTEIDMVDGWCRSVVLPRDVVHAAEDTFESATVDALNAAIGEHDAVLSAALLEAGGLPNAISALHEAQSYLTSALMMQMED